MGMPPSTQKRVMIGNDPDLLRNATFLVDLVMNDTHAHTTWLNMSPATKIEKLDALIRAYYGMPGRDSAIALDPGVGPVDAVGVPASAEIGKISGPDLGRTLAPGETPPKPDHSRTGRPFPWRRGC